jgi:hypothetical protein
MVAHQCRWSVIAVTAVQVVFSSAVCACPVCDTGTGEQVRAGILNGNFAATAATVLLPFPILLGVVALIHFGWPVRRRASEVAPSSDDPTDEDRP